MGLGKGVGREVKSPFTRRESPFWQFLCGTLWLLVLIGVVDLHEKANILSSRFKHRRPVVAPFTV